MTNIYGEKGYIGHAAGTDSAEFNFAGGVQDSTGVCRRGKEGALREGVGRKGRRERGIPREAGRRARIMVGRKYCEDISSMEG